MTMNMFCYQCEQTAGGAGCSVQGVCGKQAPTANEQDRLIRVCKQIARYAHRARQLDMADPEIDRFVIEALFVTVTNVNFDAERVAQWVARGEKLLGQAEQLYRRACTEHDRPLDDVPPVADPVPDQAILKHKQDQQGSTVTGLQELITYGLKGMAAYADHAMVLGQEDDHVYAFFLETLDYLADNPAAVEQLTAKALEVGRWNIRVMEMLDKGNTGHFGHPEPTEVRVTPVAGKCIVVSGHDLRDLELLLEQTQDKGINVYTHGEMLPCLAYPELKKYPHLVGNYGGAWQDQRQEFAAFPGAILMTTNCIQKPTDEYVDRIFTTGLVAWPGVGHIGEDKDFTPVIEAALAAPGFTEDAEEKAITIGFARQAVLNAADVVVDAVKNGDIRHFFLIGGCDGARSGRNYYTEFAQAVPDDCVILTLACGKYRFNKLPFGTIGPLPRLLDVGQCNDAYSAVKIAQALAEAFDCEVNDLPLSMILSWYEQKAVVILLSLLHLGITKMKLGPTLPAFVTPDVLGVLVDTFKLAPVGDVQEDLAESLNRAG